jgi:VIT family
MWRQADSPGAAGPIRCPSTRCRNAARSWSGRARLSHGRAGWRGSRGTGPPPLRAARRRSTAAEEGHHALAALAMLADRGERRTSAKARTSHRLRLLNNRRLTCVKFQVNHAMTRAARSPQPPLSTSSEGAKEYIKLFGPIGRIDDKFGGELMVKGAAGRITEWVRPHVPESSDGILTSAGICEGFAGAGVGSGVLIFAGFAALVAGTLAMGAVEYSKLRRPGQPGPHRQA